jgi:hypothetical protein
LGGSLSSQKLNSKHDKRALAEERWHKRRLRTHADEKEEEAIADGKEAAEAAEGTEEAVAEDEKCDEEEACDESL